MKKDVNGIELTPETMEHMLVELFSGKRVKKWDAIEACKAEYVKRGGIVAEDYNLSNCFKHATQNLKHKGRIRNPVKGYWDILRSPDNQEVEVVVKTQHQQKAPTKFHAGCKRIGKGEKEVYVYYYPAYRELAELKGEQDYPCKVGMSFVGATTRVASQCGTAMPEYPKVDLIIKTDQPELVEKTIHDVLALNGCDIKTSPGNEWFKTNPTRVMIICMRLDLTEGDYQVMDDEA